MSNNKNNRTSYFKITCQISSEFFNKQQSYQTLKIEKLFPFDISFELTMDISKNSNIENTTENSPNVDSLSLLICYHDIKYPYQ